MSRIGIVTLVCILPAMGCGAAAGSGGRLIQGETDLVACHGTQGNDVVFVIFSDLMGGDSSEGYGTRGSGSARSWYGSISPKDGEAIRYESDGTTLDLDGTQYSLADGRVFCVTKSKGELKIAQLASPTTTGAEQLPDKLKTLAETEEVQGFFSDQTE